MYYILLFLTVSLISVGLLVLKKPFFSFAYATSVLLNSMLESNLDEEYKQKQHLRSLGKMLPTFGLLLALIIAVIIIALTPMLLYLEIESKTVQEIDTSSFYFYSSMILGSVVLFVFPSKHKNRDYSGWSKLLHKMLLDNYNISKSLFNLENRLYRKKLQSQPGNFIIVTGLARGGTTALTNLLFESNKFYSLSYDNMPFLLSVNLWKKFYHPKKNKLKQRAHGDNIMFGYKTIEALEEYFFKVFLNDGFISSDKLIEHDINEDTYKAYLTYQQLIGMQNKEQTYLAKNNNLILRYKSLRKFNPQFKIILIFRSPLAHAYSLLNQHKRFSKLHHKDPFTLEYMNWLGHHEFGLNHKAFDLNLMEVRNNYDKSSIHYWLAAWISYYTYILHMIDDDPEIYLIDYTDLCKSPRELLLTLGIKLNMDLNLEQRNPYEERELPEFDIEVCLKQEADRLFNELIERKIVVS